MNENDRHSARRIVKICKKCGGSGNKLKGVKPIRFVPCNKCCGRGGRTEDRG